jgi:hypothetical protein
MGSSLFPTVFCCKALQSRPHWRRFRVELRRIKDLVFAAITTDSAKPPLFFRQSDHDRMENGGQAARVLRVFRT